MEEVLANMIKQIPEDIRQNVDVECDDYIRDLASGLCCNPLRIDCNKVRRLLMPTAEEIARNFGLEENDDFMTALRDTMGEDEYDC